ncbi:MAG: tryptophan synthase subunit alpha [Acidobacteria bacterium RIFCSPLOWO2_12_FULL_54_10]|nr:MAG: tryptophan synthase subunit alpha [Acidobacteria bacterium RIFCSPLOWO2_12_FULL_54_10]
MPTRIVECWNKLHQQGEKAFIGFVMAGDPDIPRSIDVVLALAEAKTDIIELGIPFSEPIADGPVIQRAGERALKNGVNLPLILDMVRQIRKKSDVPLLLFSYLNPILRYGLERFAKDTVACGADGALITDLSVEEADPFVTQMRLNNLDTVFLVAPTSTDERIKRAAELSTGFLYAVSRTGVTGTREQLSDTVTPLLRRLRAFTTLPVGVGFGISRPEHLAQLTPMVDGVVVGSALVRCIEDHQENPALHVAQMVRWLREGFTANSTSKGKSSSANMA